MRRGPVLFLAFLALTACHKAGETADLTDTRVPPQLGPRFYPPEGWAWGFVDKVRYGVASPNVEPRGHIVLLAGSDEPAEVYFETVKDLTAKGWTVWVMDAAPDPISGAASLRNFIDNVVRPRADKPLILAGTDTGAVAALLTVERNPRRVDGLFLWSPRLAEPLAATARERVKSGLGLLAPETERDWLRPDYDLSERRTLVEAWRTANPDLRPKKRPWKWFDAQGQALIAALSLDSLHAVLVPTVVMGDGPPAENACRSLGHCSPRALANGVPAHLATDDRRGPWLKELSDFADSVAAHTL